MNEFPVDDDYDDGVNDVAPFSSAIVYELSLKTTV